MKKLRKSVITFLTFIILIMVATLILLWKFADNTTLELTEYTVTATKIPSSFNGYRIAQVSDLHNAVFSPDNEPLLSLLRASNPDIIVFTGDQIDSRKTDAEVVLSFAQQAVKIAPCYLVTGNHEGSIPITAEVNTQLEQIGVAVLEDEIITLTKAKDTINLIGINDPTIKNRFLEIGQEGAADEVLGNLCSNLSGYSILLSHHPEYLDIYAKYNIDLVLCGHAHGGQVRIGELGMIAPHQGLFPKYDSGCYTQDNTTMILSRGLGNSLFPYRINNQPEVVLVELVS